LTKENALDWFQQLEFYLRGERLWKVIEQVMTERANPTRLTETATPGQPTPERSPEQETLTQLGTAS
jgi:hypothetical protein